MWWPRSCDMVAHMLSEMRVWAMLAAVTLAATGCVTEVEDELDEPDAEALGVAASAITTAPDLAPCDAPWVHPGTPAGNYMLVTNSAGQVVDYVPYKPSAIGVVFHDLGTGHTYEVVADQDFHTLVGGHQPVCQEASLLPTNAAWAPGAPIGAPLPVPTPVPMPVSGTGAFGTFTLKTPQIMGWEGSTVSPSVWATSTLSAPSYGTHTSYCYMGLRTYVSSGGFYYPLVYKYGAITNSYGYERVKSGSTYADGSKKYLMWSSFYNGKTGRFEIATRAARIEPDRVLQRFDFFAPMCE